MFMRIALFNVVAMNVLFVIALPVWRKRIVSRLLVHTSCVFFYTSVDVDLWPFTLAALFLEKEEKYSPLGIKKKFCLCVM